MRGVFLGHQRIEPGKIEPLGLDLIEQAGQLAGQTHRLVLARRLAAHLSHVLDQLPEQKLALERRHNRRQVHAVTHGLGRRLAREQKLLRVEIAERHEARQEQRAAVRGAQESLLQGAAGAPRRQQNGAARERQRIAVRAPQQPARERIDEGDAGRNGEDRGRAAAGRHRWTEWKVRGWSASATSFKPSGVPMWNHSPSCLTPARRPASRALS